MSGINADIGKRLRMRRAYLGLSQVALGRNMGISAQQVQKYENGTNSMTAGRLHEFAQILNVTPAYFFEDIEKPASHSNTLLTEIGKTAKMRGMETTSERELIEAMKSFRKIKDKMLRKRVADLLRAMLVKNI